MHTRTNQLIARLTLLRNGANSTLENVTPELLVSKVEWELESIVKAVILRRECDNLIGLLEGVIEEKDLVPSVVENLKHDLLNWHPEGGSSLGHRIVRGVATFEVKQNILKEINRIH